MAEAQADVNAGTKPSRSQRYATEGEQPEAAGDTGGQLETSGVIGRQSEAAETGSQQAEYSTLGTQQPEDAADGGQRQEYTPAVNQQIALGDGGQQPESDGEGPQQPSNNSFQKSPRPQGYNKSDSVPYQFACSSGMSQPGAIPKDSALSSEQSTKNDSERTSEVGGSLTEVHGGHLHPLEKKVIQTINPDTTIDKVPKYLNAIIKASEHLIVVGEQFTLHCPRMVAAFQHLAGSCPHLQDMCNNLARLEYDLATHSVRMLAFAHQTIRVFNVYKPTVSKAENCRKYIIKAIMQFIGCMQYLSIQMEDIHAYYTFFTSTDEGSKISYETHERVLMAAEKGISNVEDHIDAFEDAAVKFERAYFRIQGVPPKRKNLEKETRILPKKPKKQTMKTSKTRSPVVFVSNTYGSLKRSLTSIGRRISERIRK